jgi:phage gp45-like
MHRQTPLTAAYVGYTGSGARALVDKIDDAKGMQEMKGSMMFGEAREKIESPQNYGFTSVVKEATKGKDGQIEECAEAYLSYLGGNRSFPVATVMDDRRYRLKELKPGDVAFFDHQQHQFHFNKDGAFLTGLKDKKIRFQLADVDQQQQSGSGGSGSGGGASATQQASESGANGGASSGQSGGGKKNGQKARYQKESKQFIDINKDTTDVQHDKKIKVKAGQSYNVDAPAISHKGTQYFDNDVHIMGKLYVTQGFKPGNGEWAAGNPSPGPSDFDDPVEYVTRPPPPLTEEQQAFLARKRALADKIRITDEGVFIDGDFTVSGNLTVSGVVRAKDFVKVE